MGAKKSHSLSSTHWRTRDGGGTLNLKAWELGKPRVYLPIWGQRPENWIRWCKSQSLKAWKPGAVMLKGRRGGTNDLGHIITFNASKYSIVCMFHDLFHNFLRQFPTKRHAEIPKILLPIISNFVVDLFTWLNKGTSLVWNPGIMSDGLWESILTLHIDAYCQTGFLHSYAYFLVVSVSPHVA